MNGRRGGAAMRLRGLMRKEALQIVRDPSSIAIAFVMPVVLLLLFGYGVSLDAEHVPVALVVEQPSAATASLTGAFGESIYFEPVAMGTLNDAREALLAGKVRAVIHLRQDFARHLHDSGGEAPIHVIVDGADSNTARIIMGYVEGVWAGWIERRRRERDAGPMAEARLDQRVWFNSALRSRNFLVPGLIAVIMTLIGALLTAMVVAREWERGTLEALLATPVRMREILLGKLVPYFLLGMGGLALSVTMAVFLFEVPLRGSLWVLGATSSLFLLTALAMGLLISSIARNQFVAGQIAIVTTYLPALLLSGFLFDIASMPAAVRVLTHVIAARYFVSILQTVFLAGDVWSVILPNTLALVAMAAVFVALTARTARRGLA